MKVGMVTMCGTKMSKSLGNMVFVRDVLAHYSANALRLALLRQPYRTEYEYRDADVRHARDRVEQIVEARDQL